MHSSDGRPCLYSYNIYSKSILFVPSFATEVLMRKAEVKSESVLEFYPTVSQPGGVVITSCSLRQSLSQDMYPFPLVTSHSISSRAYDSSRRSSTSSRWWVWSSTRQNRVGPCYHGGTPAYHHLGISISVSRCPKPSNLMSTLHLMQRYCWLAQTCCTALFLLSLSAPSLRCGLLKQLHRVRTSFPCVTLENIPMIAYV